MKTKRYYALIFYILYLILTGCATTPSPSNNNKEVANINALVNNSLALALSGDTVKAEAMIKQALALDAEHVNANNIAGLIYSYSNQSQLATQHFQKALSIAPNDASTLNNYGNFLCEAGNSGQAEQVFLRAATNPNNANPEIAYTNAGLCSIRALDNKKASNYFVTALDFREENPIAYFHLAQINLQNNLAEPALVRLQSYERHAKHTPQSLKLAIEIARALENTEIENDYLIQLQANFPSSEEYNWAISN